MKEFVQFLFILVIGFVIGACSRMEQEKSASVQHDGFVIGNEKLPPPALVVGVGDSVPRLLERNPFLRVLNIQKNEALHLPLLRTTDVTYDDGRWKLKIGCVTTSNLDGTDAFPGVRTVGLTLCDPSLNDWKGAVRRAAELVRKFREANPAAVDISSWLKGANESEWRLIGGDAWALPGQRKVMSVQEAEDYFSKLSGMSQRDAEVAGMLEGVSMGVYLGEKVIFEVGISKQTRWGGVNLTESQRSDRNYAVEISFMARRDVAYQQFL